MVKAPFKRTFNSSTPQLTVPSSLQRMARPLHLTKEIQKEQINSRFVQPFSLILNQEVRDNEEVRLSLSKGQLQNGVPGLLTPSPLTKIRQSKMVRTTEVTTSSRGTLLEASSLDNKALCQRVPSHSPEKWFHLA